MFFPKHIYKRNTCIIQSIKVHWPLTTMQLETISDKMAHQKIWPPFQKCFSRFFFVHQWVSMHKECWIFHHWLPHNHSSNFFINLLKSGKRKKNKKSEKRQLKIKKREKRLKKVTWQIFLKIIKALCLAVRPGAPGKTDINVSRQTDKHTAEYRSRRP